MHLIRNTFRYASKKYWDELKRDVRPIYTAPSLEAAEAARDLMFEKWGDRYPAIQKLWENAWEQFTPFLQYDAEIRKVICSTNAIESLNARFRRSVRARGALPDRTGSIEMPLSDSAVTRPHRERTSTLDNAMETRAQRVRHHFR